MSDIEVIQTRPELADSMIFAPAIRIGSDSDLIFVSGISAQPLYPDDNFVMPDDVGKQARLAVANIKAILDAIGAEPKNVIRMTNYYLEWGFLEPTRALFGDWIPCSTAVGVSALAVPGAKFTMDLIIAM